MHYGGKKYDSNDLNAPYDNGVLCVSGLGKSAGNRAFEDELNLCFRWQLKQGIDFVSVS